MNEYIKQLIEDEKERLKNKIHSLTKQIEELESDLSWKKSMLETAKENLKNLEMEL